MHGPNCVTPTFVSYEAYSVLGGGIAVNSALWWKPHPGDWDRNFPDGWKSTDMAKSTDKVFQRIPGVSH
jgi:cellobiose dehydrogenase (acceptor)